MDVLPLSNLKWHVHNASCIRVTLSQISNKFDTVKPKYRTMWYEMMNKARKLAYDYVVFKARRSYFRGGV